MQKLFAVILTIMHSVAFFDRRNLMHEIPLSLWVTQH